jgi:hypothetical protein
MARIQHPTNPDIFVATPEEFGIAITGDFSLSPTDWIASVKGRELDLVCESPEQAFADAERYCAREKADAEYTREYMRLRAEAEAKPVADVDFKGTIARSFASGQGVVNLSPDMSSSQVADLIKNACIWSQGAAFQVIETPS